MNPQIFRVSRAPEHRPITAEEIRALLWRAFPQSEWEVREVQPQKGEGETMIDKEEVLDQLDRQREFLYGLKTEIEAQFNMENKWGAIIEGVTVAMNIIRGIPDKEAQKEEAKP